MTAKKVFAQPIIRLRLHEEIVTVIQKQIMDGTIPPGSKLPPEREMAESFNVNRATVREALRKLENLDLLETRHGNGLYAKNYLESGNLELIKVAFDMGGQEELILNILEARRYVVPQMAYLAAKRRTTDDLRELRQVISNKKLTMLEQDIKVHQIIARATRNLVCTIGLNFFNQIFRDYGYIYFDDEQNVRRSRVFHREIYEAIKNKKPEDARRVMLDVLIYVEDVVNQSLNNKR